MPGAFKDAERRWSERWRSARVYERDASPGTPKFFATYPYSYMNSLAHVGHAYTMLRVDFFVRYHRMRGRNALYPFAFHVTGTPIVAAAKRVADREPTMLHILKEQGIPDAQVAKFSDPLEWIRYFPKEWERDVDALGLGLDWRRKFHTTEANPKYDAFIRWQFRKLKEQGLVAKGRHPIIWCPKDEAPVADHDRVEGEGETPQEWVVYRMPVEGAHSVPGLAGKRVVLLAATLRPDTVFGQTNVWVDAAHDYAALAVGDEAWLTTKGSEGDFPLQREDVRPLPGVTVPGKALVGLHVRTAANGRVVPVLPARFIRHDKATGIVTSVPSDSPQDLASLEALQKGSYDAGLSPALLAEVRKIEPLPVIRTGKYGTASAGRASKEAGVRHDRDAAAIEEATTLAYNAGFYEGVLLDHAGPFAGKRVAEVKDGLTKWLGERGEAFTFHWPSGRVVCRCLTPASVKIVSDQWFLRYGDDAWKAKARECLAGMRLHPELVRKQFEHTLGWLRDWPCARGSGLGTRLPWDDRWLIESLSDSTIYMAYYTFAHFLENAHVNAADVTDALFDFVLLGKGDAKKAAKGTVTADLAERMRREFDYWYPMDFRNSGKDLVQNHLAFALFHHVAIFPREKWPRAYGVNGWVLVDGEKMSKSKGNFVVLRNAVEEFGASETRLTLAYAGEGLDDPNFEREFARNAGKRLRAFLAEVTEKAPARTASHPADRYFASVLARAVRDVTAAMEDTRFRTALKVALFDLPRDHAWYVKRSGGTPHADLEARYRDALLAMLTPFVPHLAEEAWSKLGRKGFAIDAPWPAFREADIDAEAEASESFFREVLEDTREILKVTGMTPKRVVYYTAPGWKRALHAKAAALAKGGRLDAGALIKAAMADAELKKHAKEVPKVAPKVIDAVRGKAPADVERALGLDEVEALEQAKPFLEDEFKARIEVQAGDAVTADPGKKAAHALPGRPAIYVE